jgi:hypothetical protein
MKATQEQVRQAILFIAKMYGKEDNYKVIMETNPGLPKVVEMISYEMFLNKFDPFYCRNDEYEQHKIIHEQYKIIHEYATELNKNGFVEFI